MAAEKTPGPTIVLLTEIRDLLKAREVPTVCPGTNYAPTATQFFSGVGMYGTCGMCKQAVSTIQSPVVGAVVAAHPWKAP